MLSIPTPLPRGAGMTASKLLAVENLAVNFQVGQVTTEVVRGISFEMAAAETLALVGESGCGKTVTALALLGLLPANASVTGRIVWQGENLLALTDSELRRFRGRHLALVCQEPATSLNPVYAVGEQIAEVLRHHHGMARRQAWDRAVELLREVKVPDAAARARDFPHRLSGGMRQRVMLAAALAAAYLPAQRAATVDPVIALRQE